MSPTPPATPAGDRPTVFISYSHVDETWKNRVVKHLKVVLEPEGVLEPWDDRNISAGDDWRTQIEAAMARAAVAVLLISADSLVSQFIRDCEVPYLLLRRKKDGIRIIPLIVHACGWKTRSWIEATQCRPKDGKALSSWTEHEVDEALTALALEIRDLLSTSHLPVKDVDGTSAQVSLEFESMKKIRKIMAEFIPEFEQLFPDDLESKFGEELRRSEVFRIHTKRALVVGRTGAGKTTTINRLFEQEILPTTGKLTCTSCLACGEHRHGLILYDSPGIGDEEAAEDVARIACGLPQIGSPLERLKLIDLTPARSEGPTKSNVHLIEEFQDQINPDYYRNNAGSIAFKSFSVEDFRQWASFDFLIFVMNTSTGLLVHDLRFLTDTIKVASERSIQVFKVINVFDGTFQGSITTLTPEANAKVEQAKQRLDQKLTERGITHPGPWLLVNSRSGEGVDRLISALADSLPDDVLRTLEQTLRSDYQHLIRGRLAARFFDYVARVAALVGVFPADYETQGIDLLKFAIQSILIMAEYLLARGKVSFATDVIDEMVSDLQDDREKTTYRTVTTEVTVPTGSALRDFWREIRGTEEKKIVSERVLDDISSDIGGKKAIRLALAIGLTLQELFRDAEVQIKRKTLRKRIADNTEIVRDRLKRRCDTDAIKETLEDARDLEGKKKKKRAKEAENLWKELRPALDED